MRKHIELVFEGFWNERSISKIPHESGVFVVTDGLLDDDGKNVSLQRLIYVGCADDVNTAVKQSPLWERWQDECGVSNITDANDIPAPSGEDNELFFSFAPISGPERERAVCAIAFEQQPPANDEGKEVFNYEDTKMSLSGKTGLLNKEYEVIFDYADAPQDDDAISDEFIYNKQT